MQQDNLVQEAVRIATMAGQIVMRHFKNASTRATLKTDGTPITEADLEANHFITAELSRATPEIPLISEEGELPAYETRSKWTRFWLIDPIDGTKSFASGSPHFTVNIALIENSIPTFGVISAPAMGLTYFGSILGSYRVEGAHETLIQSAPQLAVPLDTRVALKTVETSSAHSPRIDRLLKQFNVQERTKVASSIKFGFLAEGKANIYPRYSRMMEWDTAAGDAIYRYAGAKGVNFSPLKYNKPEMTHGPFILGVERELSWAEMTGEVTEEIKSK